MKNKFICLNKYVDHQEASHNMEMAAGARTKELLCFYSVVKFFFHCDFILVAVILFLTKYLTAFQSRFSRV